MRQGQSRAKALANGSDEGTSLSVECADGHVLLLIAAKGHAQPAVFGFEPGDAKRFAERVLEAAEEAHAMRCRVVT